MRLDDAAEKLPAAGLGLGAIAWGTSTELNYALAPLVCVVRLPLIQLATAVLVLIGLTGIWLSILAWRHDRPQPSPEGHRGGVPHKLLAGIGILAGVLFTTIIVMQGIASLFLSGCE